jgi:glutamyl-tRNA synthetase/nondiscriminating glutamyl-tRNA synthetase
VFAPASTKSVISAFGERAAVESLMTVERFNAIMNEVKAQTGVKGKDLFHPVRIVLIGAHSGPGFDKLIPVIEDGSRLQLPVHVKSVRERVEEFMQAMREPAPSR